MILVYQESILDELKLISVTNIIFRASNYKKNVITYIFQSWYESALRMIRLMFHLYGTFPPESFEKYGKYLCPRPPKGKQNK